MEIFDQSSTKIGERHNSDSGKQIPQTTLCPDADSSQPRPDQCGQIVKGRKHQRGTKKHQKNTSCFWAQKH